MLDFMLDALLTFCYLILTTISSARFICNEMEDVWDEAPLPHVTQVMQRRAGDLSQVPRATPG